MTQEEVAIEPNFLSFDLLMHLYAGHDLSCPMGNLVRTRGIGRTDREQIRSRINNN